uniref:Uncharacterized protein n=2 Tax=Bacteria TaxID=2 RepID=Q8RTU7_9PROT|nr:hypothetical protein MBMO_EBAC000-65D09.34 [uncultured marine proteobacterium]AAR38272.1 conserved hypothetical protein [uncultured marine bacterium 581]
MYPPQQVANNSKGACHAENWHRFDKRIIVNLLPNFGRLSETLGWQQGAC